MKTAAYYIALFLVIFFVVMALAPAADPSGAPEPDRIMRNPWQNYRGVIRV